MQKFRTSTYLKALSLVALALYFTNCAPKGPSQESQLKAHCLQSMDPKADFATTAEKLSENAKVRVVTADYFETTLRDDQPIEDTSLDAEILIEKPAKQAKTEIADSLLPEKFCGTHQIKLGDGTIARISGISDNHLEATWTAMKNNGDNSKVLDSVNSITYRSVIDPDTKLKHLEITEINLLQDRKRIVKKNLYIGESLSTEIKLNASVLKAMSKRVSPDLIDAMIPFDNKIMLQVPGLLAHKEKFKKYKTQMIASKLTLSPLQMDQMQRDFQAIEAKIPKSVLNIDPDVSLALDPMTIEKLQSYITTANQKVKINESTQDIDGAEVRLGNPSTDKSTYTPRLKDNDAAEVRTGNPSVDQEVYDIAE